MNVIFVFSKLAGKVIYVTGGSRGIGLTMALKAARDGAKIVVAAKTADPHPKVSFFSIYNIIYPIFFLFIYISFIY